MPIYEYICETCNKKNTIFNQSIADAENEAAKLLCVRCGNAKLRRVFSRFAMGKAARSEGEEIYDFDRMTDSLEADEPSQLDNWAERVKRDE